MTWKATIDKDRALWCFTLYHNEYKQLVLHANSKKVILKMLDEINTAMNKAVAELDESTV